MNLYAKYISLLIAGFILSAHAENPDATNKPATNPLAELHWHRGPYEGQIGSESSIAVPQGYAFLDAADTKKFMEINHNLSSGDEYLLVPDSGKWWVAFEYTDSGYVKDDETIDGKALLESIKQSTQEGNVERKKRGWSSMSVLGWRFEPQYDKTNNRLEWALLGQSDNTKQIVVNYNTRLLGREGLIQAVLVAAPDDMDVAVSDFKQTLNGFQFSPGKRYAEFRSGDRVAEFGLGALIAGGAAAAIAKTGAGKGLLSGAIAAIVAAKKLIVLGIAAIGAAIKKMFSKKS